MARKHILSIAILVLVIAGIGIILYNPFNISAFSSGQDAANKAKTLYELTNPGLNITVEKIDDVSGIYHILLKAVNSTGAVNYHETYITKDGKLLTESVILVNESISQVTRINNFVDCLDNRTVRIFGISNQTATILQFNILGGPYATKLYINCDGDRAQQCVNAGIIQVPSVVYGNKGYPGVQPISFFENLTQCKF